MALAGTAFTPMSANALIGVHDFSVTPSTPQAGGHPDVQIAVDFCGSVSPCKPSVHETLKSLIIHLPPGLLANPLAVPTCEPSNPLLCGSANQVGSIAVEGETESGLGPLSITGQIYNIPPEPGELARFEVYVPDFPIASQQVGFTLGSDGTPQQAAIDFPQQLLGEDVKVRSITYMLSGAVGGVPFMYNPTTCGSASASIDVNSYQDTTFNSVSSDYTASGCGLLPSFTPSITLTPETTASGSPSGYTLGLDSGFDATADPVSSYIRDTRFVFPKGLALSASGGGKLDSCNDAQLASDSCPADSLIGTIEVTSPFVSSPIAGAAYFGVPTPSEPYPVVFGFSGGGVDLSLHSTSQVDEATGQITAITVDVPQLPFSHFELHLRGGDYAVLVNPTDCGSYSATATFTPWSGQPDHVAQSTPPFTIDSCPNPRPFQPGFSASVSNTAALAHTHLRTIITRNDGDEQLTGLKLESPKGLTATLASVPQCAADLAKAGDCPDASRIGDIAVKVGAGNAPLEQHGAMYLTAPLRDGDVIGFAFVIAAKAGPIDFGKFVSTSGVKLNGGGDSAATEATSIPTIFKGVPVPVRLIDVDLNSDQFLINPSNCDPKQFEAEFLSPLPDVHASATSPYQLAGCAGLPFHPKLTFATDARGQGKYNNQRWHPPLKAVLTQDPGEAAIRATRTAIPDILRPNLAAVQTSLCQGATPHACPPSDRIGVATVETPLLASPLTGYMYLLQEPGKILPKIALALDGPVSVDVDSRNTIEGVRTVNYFDNVPDLPIRRVALDFYGGNSGILNAFDDLCKQRSYGDVSFSAHNGKNYVDKPLLQVDGCPAVVHMSLKSRRLKVSKRGIVRLELRCPGSRRCSGEVQLQESARAARKAAVYARKRISIRAHRTALIKLKLTRKALKKIRRRGTLKARVRIALEKQPALTAGTVLLSRR